MSRRYNSVRVTWGSRQDNGITITYDKKTDSVSIFGWYDQFAGMGNEVSMPRQEFLEQLGLAKPEVVHEVKG